MILEYKLTRLPDDNGRIMWKMTPPKNGPYVHISWNIESIERHAAELKIGETKIIKELK